MPKSIAAVMVDPLIPAPARLRLWHAWTGNEPQKVACRRLGITHQTFAAALRGERITLRSMERIEVATGIPVSDWVAVCPVRFVCQGGGCEHGG